MIMLPRVPMKKVVPIPKYSVTHMLKSKVDAEG